MPTYFLPMEWHETVHYTGEFEVEAGSAAMALRKALARDERDIHLIAEKGGDGPAAGSLRRDASHAIRCGDRSCEDPNISMLRIGKMPGGIGYARSPTGPLTGPYADVATAQHEALCEMGLRLDDAKNGRLPEMSGTTELGAHVWTETAIRRAFGLDAMYRPKPAVEVVREFARVAMDQVDQIEGIANDLRALDQYDATRSHHAQIQRLGEIEGLLRAAYLDALAAIGDIDDVEARS